MKSGEMQKQFFRFLDRLPYFPIHPTIVLNVKVKNQLFYTYPLKTNSTMDLLNCDFFYLMQKIF